MPRQPGTKKTRKLSNLRSVSGHRCRQVARWHCDMNKADADTTTLQIVTLCDVELRVPENVYDVPIDFVFCLGDLDDIWMANRVEQLNPRYGAYGVRGNHDVEYPFPQSIRDLNFKSEEVVVGGRKIRLAGVPGSWRYKPYGYWLYYQDEMDEILAEMPAADIVLSHNCPVGIGHEQPGESLAEDNQGTHQGFTALNDYIARCQPAFLFHGHQHFRKTTAVQTTVVAGCYGEAKHEIIWNPRFDSAEP